MISLVLGLMYQSCKQCTGLYYIFLYFILSFLFSFFISNLDKRSGITSYVTVTQVTKCDRNMTYFTVMVTSLCNTKKIIEGSRIDNIIQYSNNILALQKVHVLQSRLGQLYCVHRPQSVVYKVDQFVLRTLLSSFVFTQRSKP